MATHSVNLPSHPSVGSSRVFVTQWPGPLTKLKIKEAQRMNADIAVAPPSTDSDLLIQIRSYLTQRELGLPRSQDLEDAWQLFFDHYDRKIRAYAFTCGATEEDVADCVQEVWTELMVRLPTFRLDPERGKFDTWLFNIVRGKAVDLHRFRQHPLWQANSGTLRNLTDDRPRPGEALEEEETVALALEQLRQRLSECTFQVLYLRLVEQWPVAEVAQKLGLSREQVWYRYHRARRDLEEIGLLQARGQLSSRRVDDSPSEKRDQDPEFAQGKTASPVSRDTRSSSRALPGGNRVDYVCQRVELGRREVNPEWKVEWNGDALPRPVLYTRKVAIVAYAEMCGSGDFMNTHWPRIVNAAIAAGAAAGIATIIATPTAALPIFRTEFHKQLQGNGSIATDDKVQIALSAKQEANGPWSLEVRP